MMDTYLFATMFVLSCVVASVKGEDCETYDGNGLCLEPCTNGTVLYSSDCIEVTLSRRTCRMPRARSLGVRCDYTRCECRKPKVYDEAAKKCVLRRDCSDQSNVEGNYYD